jgi:hypothetical protein
VIYNQKPSARDTAPEVDIAARLAEQLIRFHGCDAESHCQARETHHANTEGHLSLSDFARSHSHLPNTLESADLLKVGEISTEEAAQWQHIFHGTLEENSDRPRQICLHCSQSSQVTAAATVMFDIDSIMGFTSSLSFAKQGIRFNLSPQVVSNLSTDLHLALTIPSSDSNGGGNARDEDDDDNDDDNDDGDNEDRHSCQIPLHHIPHYQLGRLVGHEDVVLYLFFPRLFDQSRQKHSSSYLTEFQLERWTDQVLLPAIHSCVSASGLQHYPGSFKHSKLSSKAAHGESHAKINKAGSRHQLIHHFLQAESLGPVWAKVNEIVSTTAGLHDFQDVQIFFSAKNLKVNTRQLTLHRMWELFFERWEQTVNMAVVNPDQVWIDLGKEVCAEPSFLADQNSGNNIAETFLWRPCCLEKYWNWCSHGSEPRPSLRRIYHTGLLQDVQGMTVLSAKSSSSARQGLLYSQFYCSQKEIFDAAKIFPFQDPALESLALDSQVRASWQHTAGSVNHNPRTLVHSYMSSKARCAAGIAGSMQKSFGTREEYRTTLSLARQVRVKLRESPDQSWSREIILESTMSQPFWRIPTAVFLGYLRANINRFTTGFEYVHTLGAHGYVSWEHSQIMIMFLRLLKFSYGSHQLSREIALWWDSKCFHRSGRHAFGLGFSVTLPQFGYCWFLPKIDWTHFVFRQGLQGQSLFGNVRMAEAYQARWLAVRESKDDFVKIEAIISWLQQHRNVRSVRRILVNQLIYICVRHFRKDVFASIKKSIQPEHWQNAVEGNITLCKINLDHILLPTTGQESLQYRLATGNKLAYKDLDRFADFLWNFNDGHSRTHWENKSYRMLYQRASKAVTAALGLSRARSFAENLKCHFYRTNWVVPYPNDTVFWQHTKKGERMWLSVWHPGVHDRMTPGQTLRLWTIFENERGNCWRIGLTNNPVMQGVPEDLRSLSLDEIEQRMQAKLQDESHLVNIAS